MARRIGVEYVESVASLRNGEYVVKDGESVMGGSGCDGDSCLI